MDRVFILGDHHGQYGGLFRDIEGKDLKNSILIHVGDGGEGFPNLKNPADFEHLNKKFKGYNCKYYSIRGNHSDPSLFQGEKRVVLSHFELLEDYSTMEINGELWQFVGGAVSVDRQIRTPNVDYWRDEVFNLDLEKAVKCDVLVTHSAPTWNGPQGKTNIERWVDDDSTLWGELVAERQQIDKLINFCRPKRHYCGHFHAYSYQDLGETQSRIIEIDGIYLDSGR